MEFTPEQKLAITLDGQNLLVSAGAGSGKTAVLTERVLEKLHRGVSVDDLIILTFTNAAAAEMKNRIKAEILKNPSLKSQLRRLDNAVITTFDSFALQLVKEYHFLLEIGEDIRIVDQAVLKKNQETILEEILDRRYREKNQRFLQTIDRLFDKGDGEFREAVMVLAKAMEMQPDPLDFLDRYEDRFFGPDALESQMKAFRSYLSRQASSLLRTRLFFTQPLRNCPEPKIQEWLFLVDSGFDPFASEDDADRLLSLMKNLQIPPSPRLGKETQEIWGETLKATSEGLREAVKKARSPLDKLFLSTLDEGKNALAETRPCVMEVVSCTREYLEKLDSRKREKNLFDFGDIMQMAIRLLETHPELTDEYKNRIDEILVDEYQDTNDLQDHFLSLLENKNLFLVGDVKQSIYGFRNANPQNFLRIYHDYDRLGTGKTVDLLANFRSRKEVLDGINRLFQNVMDEAVGGVDYQNRQALVCGNSAFRKYPIPETEGGLCILSYQIPPEKEGLLSKPFREGAIIAADIRRKLESGLMVYDLRSKLFRPAALGDFAILVDRKSGFEDYEKALVDAGLPVLSLTDEPFIASSEILFVNNALRLIQCFLDLEFFKNEFSRAVLGVARSFAFEIPDPDLLDLLSQTAGDPLALRKKMENLPVFSEMISLFEGLAARAEKQPLEDTLTDLMQKTSVFLKLSSLPDPESVERKLLFLIEKAKELPDFTLNDLLEYFDDLYRAKDLDIEFSRPYDPSVNAVRLMTMHKSKGLEFPVCYYPGLSKRFNASESKAFFQYDKRFGLVTKSWDEGFRETLLHPLVRESQAKDMISERIRLFYVALTRAREQIVLLLEEGAGKDLAPQYNAKGVLEAEQRLRFASYADLLAAIPECEGWKRSVDLPDLSITCPVREPRIAALPIQYRELSFAAQKTEVSVFSKSSLSLLTPEEKALMGKGSRIHAELERFDFQNPQKSLGRLSPELQKSMEDLLASEPLRQVMSGVVHQEYSFRQKTESGIKNGIIDLMIEYPDRIVIIDYKLKSLDDEAYRRQLSGYRDFIREVTGKPVETYLYSLFDRTLSPMGGSV